MQTVTTLPKQANGAESNDGMVRTGRTDVVATVAAYRTALLKAGLCSELASPASAVLAALDCMFRERAARSAPQRARSSDTLGEFITSTCVVTGQRADSVSASELHSAYIAWCRRGGATPRTRKALGLCLGRCEGVTRVVSGTVRYCGLRLVDETASPASAEPVR